MVILYMFLHSFLAHNRVKRFFYKNIFNERYYRFFFVSYATLFLLPIMYLYSIGDKKNYFSTNVYTDTIGLVIIIFSVYIFYISFKNYNIREFLGLDRLKSSEKVFYPLKVGGINKNVRHPLYSFSYTLMFGIFLISPNNYVLIASLITAIYLPIGIYFEEQKLIKEYGEKYREYIENVPMLIPKFK